MPRRRPRILAWSAAIVTLIVFVTLLVSIRMDVWYTAPSGFDLTIARGSIQVSDVNHALFPPHRLDAIVPGLHWNRNLWPGVTWSFEFSNHFFGWLLFIPLWCPLLLSATATAFLWRRSRQLPGHCPKCHYNLRGIPPTNGHIPCPECGNSSTLAP